ncbi:hypothetical protein [Actinoplanes regularis]|uniref:Uncharacterized protein n=1 Tax=Actinoplanes regularis TaxID=52697 RepID=A0A239BU41_9ACTN|nr:hypothetical protein [Actinoplanes regularis]GIE88293.1 hypothetical protein Are01nite_47730 [Actinoplanes regularis]SNS11179.1 hypothetical protein SAMN06264365_110122 [Actinoplanes regularis]
MAIDVTAAISDLISDIFNDREVAHDYASDPSGVLAARGLTDTDLSEVDIPEVTARVAAEHGQKDPYASDPGYGPGPHEGGPAAAPPTYDGEQGVGEVIQHLNYITYVTYEDDRDIIQQIEIDDSVDNSVDNSVDVSVDGPVSGYLDVDSTPTTVGHDQNIEQPWHDDHPEPKYDDDFGGGAKPDYEKPDAYDKDYPEQAGHDQYEPAGDAPAYDGPEEAPYDKPEQPGDEPAAYHDHDAEPGHDTEDHSDHGQVGVS